jgi:hypothetical protein
VLSRRRCDYEANAFAKPDPRGSFARQMGAYDNLVAVVQEFSLLTGGQSDRLGAPSS